jgi:hypothetical protein
MRRLLFLSVAGVSIILGVSSAIAAFASKATEPATPRADVYWAEARLHMKIWTIEPATDGTWKITYDIKLNGPRGVALTVPMDRPPFEPGQMVFARGKVAQTGDVLITSFEDDPDDPPAMSPSPVSDTTRTTEPSSPPQASPGPSTT